MCHFELFCTFSAIVRPAYFGKKLFAKLDFLLVEKYRSKYIFDRSKVGLKTVIALSVSWIEKLQVIFKVSVPAGFFTNFAFRILSRIIFANMAFFDFILIHRIKILGHFGGHPWHANCSIGLIYNANLVIVQFGTLSNLDLVWFKRQFR